MKTRISRLVSLGAETFVCPQTVATEAAKGLALHKEHKRGGTIIGVRRAVQLSNRRPVSLNTLQRMYSYFKRHEVDKQGKNWDRPSNGKIAWLLWGGDAGFSWVKRLLKKD